MPPTPGDAGVPGALADDATILAGTDPERRIYLDLDDVLADTTRRIVETLNQRFRRSLSFEALTCFDLGRAFELDPEEYRSAMESIHTPEFLRSLLPRENVLEQLDIWVQEGYHLAVITGRPPDTVQCSVQWLEAHELPHHSFHCVDKYGRYAHVENRTELASLQQLRFDVAIEDSLEMAQFLARNGTRRVLLMDRPWNRDTRDIEPRLRTRITRVQDWAEIARSAF